MTGNRTMKRKMTAFRNCYKHLAPHQIDQILIVLRTASLRQSGQNNAADAIIERLGREAAAKIPFDDFLKMVADETPLQ